MLAVLGGAAGAVLASWGTTVLVANGPSEIPRLEEVAVNGRVLLYAWRSASSPAWSSAWRPARMLIVRARMMASLAGAHAVTTGPAAWRYRAALIAVNVALSALLLVGSGLLVRSFVRLLTVDPGFDPHRLLTFQIDLSGQAVYPDRRHHTLLRRRLDAASFAARRRRRSARRRSFR